MSLQADPLSILFLCILTPQIIAAALAGMARSPTFWVFVLGLVIAALGANPFTLLLPRSARLPPR